MSSLVIMGVHMSAYAEDMVTIPRAELEERQVRFR
jgi:hypothetical protein